MAKRNRHTLIVALTDRIQVLIKYEAFDPFSSWALTELPFFLGSASEIFSLLFSFLLHFVDWYIFNEKKKSISFCLLHEYASIWHDCSTYVTAKDKLVKTDA